MQNSIQTCGNKFNLILTLSWNTLQFTLQLKIGQIKYRESDKFVSEFLLTTASYWLYERIESCLHQKMDSFNEKDENNFNFILLILDLKFDLIHRI